MRGDFAGGPKVLVLCTHTHEKESTVFANYRKSRIQHCERSELRLHLSGQKFIKNAKNGAFWRFFG